MMIDYKTYKALLFTSLLVCVAFIAALLLGSCVGGWDWSEEVGITNEEWETVVCELNSAQDAPQKADAGAPISCEYTYPLPWDR